MVLTDFSPDQSVDSINTDKERESQTENLNNSWLNLCYVLFLF